MLEHAQGLWRPSQFDLNAKHAAPWVAFAVLWLAAWLFALWSTANPDTEEQEDDGP